MDEPRALDRYVPGRPHWWQWLTVLSLDAPLVAVAWQAGLARAMGMRLRAHHGFILGAAVWLAYTADRWIEGWRLDPAQVRTQRHWFHQRWRGPVAVAWLAVLAATVTLSVDRLTSRELTAGLLLLGPVLAYLLSHQLVHRTHPWRAPKEICVALLFTGGAACFPAADRLPRLTGVAVPLTLFGLLCLADCALISLWEDDVDRAHGQTSLALQFPQGRPLVRALPWLIAAAGTAFAAHGRLAPAGVTWCAAASGALLGGIDLAHRRLGRQLARVLADVALMTPFVLLLAGHFARA
jgi:hypothetical protein